jgi:hypothetical protein
MKQNVLTITKTAMKFFFDIDPVLTEHMIVQTSSQSLWVQREVSVILKEVIQQGKTNVSRFAGQEAASLNTA